MKPLLTVVVPVYNVEKYLEKCLESIVKQTYTNIEIILVNDGSTDDSIIICNRFVDKDKRVRLINKENGGLSDARNVGLNQATGKYITFIDSDDSLMLDAFEVFVTEMELKQLDIISGYPITEYEDGTLIYDARKRSAQNQVLSGEDYLVKCLKESTMLWPVQFSVYRLQIIKNHEFKKGRLHEDMLWTPQAFLLAQRVECLNYEFYYYLKRTNSITHTQDKSKNGVSTVLNCYDLEKVYKKVVDPYSRKVLLNDLLKQYLNGFYLGRLSGKEYNNIISRKFLYGKIYSLDNFLKSVLFCVNKRLYLKINDLVKNITKKLK